MVSEILESFSSLYQIYQNCYVLSVKEGLLAMMDALIVELQKALDEEKEERR